MYNIYWYLKNHWDHGSWTLFNFLCLFFLHFSLFFSSFSYLQHPFKFHSCLTFILFSTLFLFLIFIISASTLFHCAVWLSQPLLVGQRIGTCHLLSNMRYDHIRLTHILLFTFMFTFPAVTLFSSTSILLDTVKYR